MIAIRPPEYWPSPEFTALMLRADRMLIGDTFRYSKQSLQHRARLRNPNGWQWISIPRQRGQRGRAIREVRINTSEPWLGRHWRAFMFNYRSSPYFEYYEPRLEPLFQKEWKHIGEIAIATVEFIREVLDVDVEIQPLSQVENAPDSLAAAADLLAGDEILTLERAAEHDQEILDSAQVLSLDLPAYDQNFDGFEPGMSVVDLLFNYGPETRLMLLEHSSIERLSEI